MIRKFTLLVILSLIPCLVYAQFVQDTFLGIKMGASQAEAESILNQNGTDFASDYNVIIIEDILFGGHKWNYFHAMFNPVGLYCVTFQKAFFLKEDASYLYDSLKQILHKKYISYGIDDDSNVSDSFSLFVKKHRPCAYDDNGNIIAMDFLREEWFGLLDQERICELYLVRYDDVRYDEQYYVILIYRDRYNSADDEL